MATVAVAVTGLVHAVATWRRWRWTPLALTGAAGLLLVLSVGGPDTLDRHLLATRELTGNKGTPVGSLIAHRWPAWIVAQLPLSVPVALVLAGVARHQVTRVPAHELSPRARHRRDAEDKAQLQKAIRNAASAPAAQAGQPVLGAWISGDLEPWHSGRWATIPERHLGLGTLLVGLPGAGKTETLLRLADLALRHGWDVHVIDAKGDATTQQRFAALAAANGIQPRLFPAEPYDGFRGDPEALRNRLARIVDYSEPYYQDGARVLLHAACGLPMRSLAELLVRLGQCGDVDPAVRKGTLSRYRSFAGAVGEYLTGGWAFEDTRASYLLLDGLGLGDDTPRLARYLLEDFSHFASTRKDPARKVLLLVDEFSALRVANAAALFERLRSFNAGVVLAAQSIVGLHDDPAERDRLLNATSTIIAHRLADPEPVVSRAGTIRRAERSHQLDVAGPTGQGSLRIQDTYRVDPNDVRSLPAGVAWIISGGRAVKIAVSRAQGGRAPLASSPQNLSGIAQPWVRDQPSPAETKTVDRSQPELAAADLRPTRVDTAPEPVIAGLQVISHHEREDQPPLPFAPPGEAVPTEPPPPPESRVSPYAQETLITSRSSTPPHPTTDPNHPPLPPAGTPPPPSPRTRPDGPTPSSTAGRDATPAEDLPDLP